MVTSLKYYQVTTIISFNFIVKLISFFIIDENIFHEKFWQRNIIDHELVASILSSSTNGTSPGMDSGVSVIQFDVQSFGFSE